MILFGISLMCVLRDELEVALELQDLHFLR